MKVTIKLIRSDVQADHIIKDDRKIHSEEIENVGTFYYKISRSAKPDWLDTFFRGRLQCSDKFRVASASGVLLISRRCGGANRIFAITFGSGRYILCDGVTEDRFGLKIALNSIQYKSLRSIDFSKMDGVPSIVRNQVSRLTGIEDFNINTQANLLKSITGNLPENQQNDIGTSMTGADSLTLNTTVNVDTILPKLTQLYSLFISDAYKLHFSWVDNISAIGEHSLIGRLDNELFAKINNREIENIWLAIPTLVDWADIGYFKYSGRGGDQHDDVSLESALEELFADNNDIKPSDFKKCAVKAFDREGTIRIKEWPLYKCLYGELLLDGKQFVLNDGSWYLVDNNFYTAVERIYNGMERSNIVFPKWRPRIEDGKEKFELEKDYNIRLADSDETFCNMDRDLVYPQGNQDRIEFCDVYSQARQLIHVKRKGGSELIGHLLNQGMVSANLLLTDELRNKLNSKFRESNRAAWCVPTNRNDFNASNYSIVFGIMSNEEGESLKIPFFSKVVLKEVVTELRNYGFKVYLNKIGKEDPA